MIEISLSNTTLLHANGQHLPKPLTSKAAKRSKSAAKNSRYFGLATQLLNVYGLNQGCATCGAQRKSF